MNTKRPLFGLLVAAVAVTMIAPAWADPLPGEILKFQQRPMVATPVEGQIYFGHDELSTAWLVSGSDPTQPPVYQGNFMADDFADRFDTPVVHVRWWGSYMLTADPTKFADKFLISFEADVPDDPDNPDDFSHPGVPLLSQVVTKGPLSPGSGTFTETVLRGPDPLLGEALYEYNAELHCPFPEKRDTVYWLKIVALDDVLPGSPGAIRWGWHNRDYTIFDPLASTPPAVVPGEFLNGVLPSGEAIWHFQDDAVSGDVTAVVWGDCDVQVDQAGYTPQNYVPPFDGPSLIDRYSKDLAFGLYAVPEPSTFIMLIAAGLLGLLMRAWRKR